MCKEIFIPGTPQAQGRPRFARRGSFTTTYDPHKDKKAWVKLQLLQEFSKPIEEALSLDVTFIMPIPKSTSKKKRALMLSGEIKHTKLPDLDNKIKFLLDSMNEIVFRDDRQVYQINMRKVYGEEPGTLIKIST